MTITEQYPECERWAAVHDQARVIGEFLEWLNADGILLSRICSMPGRPEFERLLITESRDTVIARYLGIDLGTLEAERRAMLEAMQDDQQENS